jgi:hypothetical protein
MVFHGLQRGGVDADDHLIKAADFSLTSACPMNGLVTARSALRPQAGQIADGGNTQQGRA